MKKAKIIKNGNVMLNNINPNKKLLMIEYTGLGNGYIIHTKNFYPEVPSSQIATNIIAALKITQTILEKQEAYEKI